MFTAAEGDTWACSDHLPVMRRFRKSPEQSVMSKCGMLDVWASMWGRLRTRSGIVDLRWTKSHPSQAQIED
eukprot:7418008-Pyramimonas_sp.AAC.1